MFCSNCGINVEEGNQFCTNCGERIAPTVPSYAQFSVPVKKASPLVILIPVIINLIAISWLLITGKNLFAILAIALSAVLSFVLWLMGRGKAGKLKPSIIAVGNLAVMTIFIFVAISLPGKSVNGKPINFEIMKKADSAAVSLGVSPDDLGNIMSGQYIFDAGNTLFYSSYDKNDESHIYAMDKNTSTVKSIFNGFGWSLVLYKDWLYFSGNEGSKLDGTYNLYRVKQDGSAFEKLNQSYSYGMFFYKEKLYYTKKNASDQYEFCSSMIDGSGETVILKDTTGANIIFKNQLYYVNKAGQLMSAKPDGSSPVALLTENVTRFIIGGGKFVFLNSSGDLKTASIDGTSVKLVRSGTLGSVYTFNSSGKYIYYTIVDPTAVPDRYAFNYSLNVIGFDGSNDKAIYNGISYGCYINVLGKSVYAMDYAINPATKLMPAIVKEIGQNKEGKDLAR